MNNRQGRTQLALGLILILLGAWFLADRTLPTVHELFAKYLEWPFLLVTIGAGLLLLGLLLGAPGMAVPAAIVAGIGGIFIYQTAQDDYASWSYMWTLIPGFVGVGSILAGLLGESTAHNLKRGLNLMVLSAVLFLVFSSFLGGRELLGNYVPAIALILLGLWVLGSGLFQTFRKKEKDKEKEE
jgi:hypothetical protein